MKNFPVALSIDSSTDGKDSPPSGAEDEQGVSFKGVRLPRASSRSLLIVVINLGCRRAEVQHLDFATLTKAPFEELWEEKKKTKKTWSPPQVLSHPALLNLMKLSFTLSSRRHTVIRLDKHNPTCCSTLSASFSLCLPVPALLCPAVRLASSRWVKKWRKMMFAFFPLRPFFSNLLSQELCIVVCLKSFKEKNGTTDPISHTDSFLETIVDFSTLHTQTVL